MKILKSIIPFLFLLIIVGLPSWLLYRLISHEASIIGDIEIDNIGDLISYIVVWLGHLLSIFNILLYIVVFFSWRFFFENIGDFLKGGDTKTGVDEYDRYDYQDSMWDSRNDINDDCG